MGAALGMASGFAGSVLGMMGDEQERQAAEQEAFRNQRAAETAADDALARGRQEAGRYRMEGSRLIAAQRVAYATSGVDASVGTPVDTMLDTRQASELDARTAENNAAREAWGFKQHGLRYQADRRNINDRANTRLGGTLLGMGGQMASYGAELEDREGPRKRRRY